MSNISVKLNLTQLKCAVKNMKGNSGIIECLIIPIKQNHLVKGEKGVYLDLTGFELKDKKPDRKDTHLVKQSFPKDVFEAMSDEQKKNTPIFGNMVVGGYQEPEQQTVEISDVLDEPASDLPF